MSAAHWYRAYGLLFSSELELPEFLPAAPGAADLAIRLDPEAAEQWRQASGVPETDGHRFLPAPAGGFVLRAPGVGDYWVRDGRDIALAPAEGDDGAGDDGAGGDGAGDPVSLRLFLLGSALGMALHQRGLLVLHGATVLTGRGAAIIVGESGQGKSTLAASLGRAGHAILGDDTMPLWPVPEGGFGAGFEVWPGSRMFKLWSDTIGVLGESAEGLDSVGNRLDKYFFPNAAQPADRPAPLCEVIELATAPDDAAPTLELLDGLEALRVIAAHTYRPQYVPLLGREAVHFRLCSGLAGTVSVWRLSRPRDLGRMGESLALIGARWAAPGEAAGGRPRARAAAPADKK